MSFVDLGSVFLLGLLGTGHCVGMCGAFAMAVAVGAPTPAVVVWRQVAYQLGKATSYLFIGALLLLAGTWVDQQNPVLRVQAIVGWIVGVAMILVGLAYAAEWRWPAPVQRWWQGSAACGALGALWRSPSLFKSLLAGWVNGFLPCGLSFMALLFLAGTGSATTLVVGAYVFSFATLPGLLAVALFGQKLSLLHRRRLVRASGVALVIFGVLTLVRGQPAVHHWMHEHLMFEREARAEHSSHGH